jgi:5-dehydro-4-deoxyglucarate dehydratase
VSIQRVLDRAKAAMDPPALKAVLSDGLLSFPLTCFDDDGELDLAAYRARLEWLEPYGATALFATGGTGEGFSLTQEEQARVIAASVAACRLTPILAGVGGGTRVAIQQARAAEAAGAAGILLLPHYLVEASQEGLCRHVEAVCRSVGCGVVVYNRGQCRLGPEALERLADRCANLVGLKDGLGDIELVTAISRRLGDRLVLIGGLPTAEVFAQALLAVPVNVYSSAVFNFIPRTALSFYQALRAGEAATTGRLLDEFFLPYIAIRNRVPGYAVSIVKAGARIVGRPAGPVRPPLTDLSPAEHEELAALIGRLGPQ